MKNRIKILWGNLNYKKAFQYDLELRRKIVQGNHVTALRHAGELIKKYELAEDYEFFGSLLFDLLISNTSEEEKEIIERHVSRHRDVTFFSIHQLSKGSSLLKEIEKYRGDVFIRIGPQATYNDVKRFIHGPFWTLVRWSRQRVGFRPQPKVRRSRTKGKLHSLIFVLRELGYIQANGTIPWKKKQGLKEKFSVLESDDLKKTVQNILEMKSDTRHQIIKRVRNRQKQSM